MKKKKVKVPGVGTLFIMFVLGAVGVWYHVFAPIHEFWHVLFGIVEGAEWVLWNGTAYNNVNTLYQVNNISIYAGYFGEMLALSVIIVFLLTKYKFKLATLFFGAMHCTAWYAWEGSDWHYVTQPGMVWVYWSAFWLIVTWILYLYITIRVSSLTKGN
ncbi:MAG: hypothetical protein K9M94_13010 [Spirochaetia bacterium]|nr:hypothetical protein [Spirochaetia bacterium]